MSELTMGFTPLAAAALTRANLIWVAVLVAVTTVVVSMFLFRRRWPVLVAVAKHPFAKYVLLSIIAHVAIAIWLLTSRVFAVPDPGPGPAAVVVQLGRGIVADVRQESADEPWAAPMVEAVNAPNPELPALPVDTPAAERPEANPVEDIRVDSPLADLDLAADLADIEAPSPWADAPKPMQAAQLDPTSVVETRPDNDHAESTDLSNALRPDSGPAKLQNELQAVQSAEALASELDKLTPPGSEVVTSRSANAVATDVQLQNQPILMESTSAAEQALTPVRSPRAALVHRASAVPSRRDGKPLPSIYRDRWAADRLAIARRRGGSEDTERAVQAALKWLASTQSADGRWDASQYGSGKPVLEGGHDRQGAGLNADTGITGLAVLAFLGAGYGHQVGEYSDTIHNGLNFLVEAQQQRRDGSLVGAASGYAAMYCHGIATLALSEAYSVTGDPQLLEPVRKAVSFTLEAQDRTTGGWRYQPGQAGDTSQFGWQLMALTSAHYGGIRIPHATWTSAGNFLNSVAVPGSRGGLASYRPGQRPTSAMTAEALLCRLFLRTPLNHPLIAEAADKIASDPPGSGRVNYYYWYYGTLALYHLQDANWQRWNMALKRELLRLQAGDGGWDANSVWGPSGGRVYSTALAALTLEVYYRYRPLVEPRQPESTAWRPD